MAMGITVDFNANMVQFAQQVDKIQGRMDQFQAHSEITVKRVNSIMSSLGVGLSVAGIAAFVKSGIDAADSLGKLSTRTGVAVEQLAGLKLAAELSDTSLDQIGRSINKLSIEIGRNGEAFAELGITAKEPVEAFLQLTDLFNSIEDPQRRAALMARTLGKEYAQLAPLMDQGSAAIRQQIAEGQRLNPITAESAQRAAEFNDAMTRMATRSEGARNALAIGVLEPLSFIAEALDDNIKKSGLLKGLWDGLIEGWQNFALSDTGGGLSDDLDEINRKIGETKFQLLELRNERGDSGGQLKEEVEAERVLNDLIQERDRLIKGISDQRRAAADSPVKTETAEQKAAIDRLIGGGRAGEKQGDLAREAARIFEATRTPVERYGAEIDKLNELLKAGAIDQDTYTRALQKAGEAFNTHADDVRGLSESEAFRLKQLQDSLKIFEDQARLDLQNPFLQAQGTAGAESTKSAQRAQQIANEIAALNSPVTTGGQFPAVPAGAAQGVTAPVSVQPVVEIMPIIKPDVLLQTIQEAIESVRQQLQPLIVPFEYQLVGNMPGQNGVDEQILRESLARGRR